MRRIVVVILVVLFALAVLFYRFVVMGFLN
jgi:hypothetical protein